MYSYVVVVALARNIVGRMLSTRPTTLADNISSRFCQMLASQLGLFEMHGVALEYGENAGSQQKRRPTSGRYARVQPTSQRLSLLLTALGAFSRQTQHTDAHIEV